jgi:hypothetical protein
LQKKVTHAKPYDSGDSITNIHQSCTKIIWLIDEQVVRCGGAEASTFGLDTLEAEVVS